MTPVKLSKDFRKSGGNINEGIFGGSFDKRGNDTSQRPATTSGIIESVRGSLVRNNESLESGDSIVYPSTAPESRKSVDVVVVDVHNENKGSETNLKSRKLFRDKNGGVIRSKKNQSNNEDERGRNFDKGNAWVIEESVDTIKEFQDTDNVLEINSVNNDLEISNSTESYEDRKIFESEDKFLETSADNSEAEKEIDENRFFEEPKRRRKRWSKNENNLQLTQELLVHSSDTNHSGKSESLLSNGQGFRPVPAPRKKGVSKPFDYESSLAFDNAAFLSDPEEVLRIETEIYERQGTSDGSQDYRQSTKIEMTNFYDSYNKENETRNKMETFSDSSDESDTRVQTVKKGGDLFTPNKSKDHSESDSSVRSEENQVSRFKGNETKNRKEKKPGKYRQYSKPDSTSFDADDYPRTKSRREYSRKSKSKNRPENSEYKERVRRRRSKRSVNNDEKSSDLEIIEHNKDKVEKFISVTIHKADVLETDFVTRHPMVKVHIVDMKTGNYLKIIDDDNHGRCGYLQPMITSKFDFKANRSIVPNWEEELILEYNFDHIIQTLDKQILILFEILDLLNFAEASFNYNILGNEGCWHKIAWAFLRPVGVDGTSHINKKLRLQLYEPSKASRKSGRSVKCEVFNWWQSTNREKYPSTLYVTLKSVDPPIQEPVIYERLSFNDLTDMEDESRSSFKKSSDLLQLPKWNRLAAQSCKIPNNHLFSTESFDNGSFYLTFSNNGKYLGFVGSEEDNYPIVVHTIPEGKIFAQFIGHGNFVYSLNWSNDDKYLLSVSSDQTARIWDMENKIIQHIDMLPHPSYVYCGKFYPGNKKVIITGCYDSVIRVWNRSKSRKRYELTQELYEHKGYVNSLCFQKDGGLITADSLGVIVLWAMQRRGGVSSGREWNVLKTVKDSEIENIVVNTIILHPLGSRLLVHSRDNGLRIIDLATGVVLQRYKGLRNRRLQTTACLSPCGGLVLCGGEDSYLNIWSLENGRRLARYFIREAKIISCVAYHPFDHILAFATFGSVSAIQIMNFDKNSTGENVGLNLLVDNDVEDDADDFGITMKFDKTDLVLEKDKNLRRKYSEKSDTEIRKRDRRSATEMQKYTRNENSVSRQELLKLKIQRHNDCEEDLKSRSAARLNDIIEKIDRILVNTTSKRDLDSTCSSNDILGQDTGRISSNSKQDMNKNREDKVRSRSSRGRSKDKGSTSNTDATMELSNTSKEFIEMQNIGSRHNETSENEESTSSKQRLLRLTSRTSTMTNISLAESDEQRFAYKSSGESCRKNSSYKETEFNEKKNSDEELNRQRRKSRGRKTGKRFPSSSEEKKKKSVSNADTCVIVLENTKEDTQSDPSTLDSAGTYTVDKEKSVNLWATDISKTTDTSNSVRSSATFTIENEILSASKSKSSQKKNLDLK